MARRVRINGNSISNVNFQKLTPTFRGSESIRHGPAHRHCFMRALSTATIRHYSIFPSFATRLASSDHDINSLMGSVALRDFLVKMRGGFPLWRRAVPSWATVECVVILARYGSDRIGPPRPGPRGSVCNSSRSRTVSNASYPNPRRGGIIPVSKINSGVDQ